MKIRKQNLHDDVLKSCLKEQKFLNENYWSCKRCLNPIDNLGEAKEHFAGPGCMGFYNSKVVEFLQDNNNN